PDQLQQVRDRDEEALRARPVRAVPELHPAEQLALEPRREREEHHHDVDHEERLRDRDPPGLVHYAVTSTVSCRSAAWSRATRTVPRSRSRASRATSVRDVPFDDTVTGWP